MKKKIDSIWLDFNSSKNISIKVLDKFIFSNKGAVKDQKITVDVRAHITTAM